MALEAAMMELASRFIINLPDDEIADDNRLMYKVELAFYRYADVCMRENPDLPKFTHLTPFTKILLSTAGLQQQSDRAPTLVKSFKKHMSLVPTFGGILLNANCDKLILVSHTLKPHVYNFPKGKINENELDIECAIREVCEETSYDMRALISEDDVIYDTSTLYLAVGVDESFKMHPKNLDEIATVDWFSIAELQTFNVQRKIRGTFRDVELPNLVHNVLPALIAWIRSPRGQERRLAALKNQPKRPLTPPRGGARVPTTTPVPPSKSVILPTVSFAPLPSTPKSFSGPQFLEYVSSWQSIASEPQSSSSSSSLFVPPRTITTTKAAALRNAAAPPPQARKPLFSVGSDLEEVTTAQNAAQAKATKKTTTKAATTTAPISSPLLTVASSPSPRKPQKSEVTQKKILARPPITDSELPAAADANAQSTAAPGSTLAHFVLDYDDILNAVDARLAVVLQRARVLIS